MFQIEQSTFLHALGYAIGHSLWQMSILWLVYHLVIHLNRWSSRQRYNLAVATVSIGFTWFIASLIYFSTHLGFQLTAFNEPSTFTAATTTSLTGSQKALFLYHSFIATLKSLAPYFSCAYLVVMLLLGLRLANGFQQVKQLRSTGLAKPSVEWKLFVKKHAEHLNIKKPVQLFISSLATSPLTIGFWKPIILLPIASINQLSIQQLEAVLLHELAHIRRYDYLVNILLQLAEITLFFNPFMRLLLKQVRLERENSCDDFVLQFQYNAADYAKALLAIEKQSMESLLALGSNSQNEFQLLNRIRRMVSPERKSFNYRQQLGLLFLITLFGLGFTALSPRPVVNTSTVIEKEKVTISNTHIINDSISTKAVDGVEDLQQFLHHVKNSVDNALSTEKETAIKAVEKIHEKANEQVKEIAKAEVDARVEKKYIETDNYLSFINDQVEKLSLAQKNQLPEFLPLQLNLFNADQAKTLYNNNVPQVIFSDVHPNFPFSQQNVQQYFQEQFSYLKQLQEKVEKQTRENKKIIAYNIMIADSLKMLAELARKTVNKNATKYAAEVNRLQKAIPIAPFREWNTRPDEMESTDQQFEFRYYNDKQDKNYRSKNKAVATIRKVSEANCDCPQPENHEDDKLYIINGKVYVNTNPVFKNSQESFNANRSSGNINEQDEKKAIEKMIFRMEGFEVNADVNIRQENHHIIIEIETNN